MRVLDFYKDRSKRSDPTNKTHTFSSIMSGAFIEFVNRKRLAAVLVSSNADLAALFRLVPVQS